MAIVLEKLLESHQINESIVLEKLLESHQINELIEKINYNFELIMLGNHDFNTYVFESSFAEGSVSNEINIEDIKD